MASHQTAVPVSTRAAEILDILDIAEEIVDTIYSEWMTKASLSKYSYIYVKTMEEQLKILSLVSPTFYKATRRAIHRHIGVGKAKQFFSTFARSRSAQAARIKSIRFSPTGESAEQVGHKFPMLLKSPSNVSKVELVGGRPFIKFYVDSLASSSLRINELLLNVTSDDADFEPPRAPSKALTRQDLKRMQKEFLALMSGLKLLALKVDVKLDTRAYGPSEAQSTILPLLQNATSTKDLTIDLGPNGPLPIPLRPPPCLTSLSLSNFYVAASEMMSALIQNQNTLTSVHLRRVNLRSGFWEDVLTHLATSMPMLVSVLAHKLGYLGPDKHEIEVADCIGKTLGRFNAATDDVYGPISTKRNGDREAWTLLLDTKNVFENEGRILLVTGTKNDCPQDRVFHFTKCAAYGWNKETVGRGLYRCTKGRYLHAEERINGHVWLCEDHINLRWYLQDWPWIQVEAAVAEVRDNARQWRGKTA